MGIGYLQNRMFQLLCKLRLYDLTYNEHHSNPYRRSDRYDGVDYILQITST